MDLALTVSPPYLLPWISQEQRGRILLLLDLEADQVDQSSVRFDLNVVFKPIRVRTGIITRADFYVASTGAEISLTAMRGTVTKYTQAQTLSVNYTNTAKYQRQSSARISPELKAKRDKAELEAKLGEVNLSSGTERTFSASYTGTERSLVPIDMKNQIDWMIALPRGEHVVHDFIVGNLYLFAECSWPTCEKSGSITIRPSDVRFFDGDRRPLGQKSSLRMQFALWRDKKWVAHRDGYTLAFRENGDGQHS